MSSFCTKYDSTQISVILFRRAGLSSFLPKSPDGFMVATMLKPSAPTILMASEELFSDKMSILSCSKTELSLSRTESLAKDISSISSRPPVCIASTKMPSCHSKTILSSIFRLFTFLYSSLSPSSDRQRGFKAFRKAAAFFYMACILPTEAFCSSVNAQSGYCSKAACIICSRSS